MNKEAIFIHGGNAFSKYESFLGHLRTAELWNVLGERPKRWKETLRTELGAEYDVYLPSMPNSENAKCDEWKIWFERYLALVHDGAVLVGHSLGGYFLTKYLTENEPSVRIGGLVLIAAPAYPEDFGGEDGGDFYFDTNALPLLAERAGKVVVFHSTDDPVVPFAHAETYSERVPGAELRTFIDRGHFLGETFPELIESIRSFS